MPSGALSFDSESSSEHSLIAQYERVRAQTMALIEDLSAEDMLLQSMPDASPTKWHLAHTTWFFETFLLQPYLSGYKPFDEAYQYLFNSYYETVGERHPRPQRGLLSRPPLEEVLAYREYVDKAMAQLLPTANTDIEAGVTIGLHHEMQHQELLVTDIKHALSLNPYALAVDDSTSLSAASDHKPAPREFVHFEGGLCFIGTDAQSEFAYDCEQPRHQVFVADFSLSDRLVTLPNGSNSLKMAVMNDPNSGFQMAGRQRSRKAGRPRSTGIAAMITGIPSPIVAVSH